MNGEHVASATLRSAIEFALEKTEGLEWLRLWYAEDDAASDELQAWVDAKIPPQKRVKTA